MEARTKKSILFYTSNDRKPAMDCNVRDLLVAIGSWLAALGLTGLVLFSMRTAATQSSAPPDQVGLFVIVAIGFILVAFAGLNEIDRTPAA